MSKYKIPFSAITLSWLPRLFLPCLALSNSLFPSYLKNVSIILQSIYCRINQIYKLTPPVEEFTTQRQGSATFSLCFSCTQGTCKFTSGKEYKSLVAIFFRRLSQDAPYVIVQCIDVPIPVLGWKGRVLLEERHHLYQYLNIGLFPYFKIILVRPILKIESSYYK